MILPIYGYGEAVLRKIGEDITPEYPNLQQTIANMTLLRLQIVMKFLKKKQNN